MWQFRQVQRDHCWARKASEFPNMCLLRTLYEPTWPISRTFTVTALELNNWGHAKYKTVQLFHYLGIHIIYRTSKFHGNLKKIQRMNTWYGLISQVNEILGITGQIIVANIIMISTKGGLYYVFFYIYTVYIYVLFYKLSRVKWPAWQRFVLSECFSICYSNEGGSLKKRLLMSQSWRKDD